MHSVLSTVCSVFHAGEVLGSPVPASPVEAWVPSFPSQHSLPGCSALFPSSSRITKVANSGRWDLTLEIGEPSCRRRGTRHIPKRAQALASGNEMGVDIKIVGTRNPPMRCLCQMLLSQNSEVKSPSGWRNGSCETEHLPKSACWQPPPWLLTGSGGAVVIKGVSKGGTHHRLRWSRGWGHLQREAYRWSSRPRLKCAQKQENGVPTTYSTGVLPCRGWSRGLRLKQRCVWWSHTVLVQEVPRTHGDVIHVGTRLELVRRVPGGGKGVELGLHPLMSPNGFDNHVVGGA